MKDKILGIYVYIPGQETCHYSAEEMWDEPYADSVGSIYVYYNHFGVKQVLHYSNVSFLILKRSAVT
jgi:hypothetical protein